MLLVLPALFVTPGAPAFAQDVKAPVQVAQSAELANPAPDKKKAKKPTQNKNKDASSFNQAAPETAVPARVKDARKPANKAAGKPTAVAKKKPAKPAPAVTATVPVPVQVPVDPQVGKVDRATPGGTAKDIPPIVKQDSTVKTEPDAAGKDAAAAGVPTTDEKAAVRAERKVDQDKKTDREEAKAEKAAPVSARPTEAVAKKSFVAPPKQARNFDQIKKDRKEKVSADGKVRVITETDRRVIVKQDNRVIIRNDDSERFRRVARNATTSRKSDGSVETVYARGDGVRVYNVTDRDGRILYRYRRDRAGRDVVLIDNRRSYRDDRRDRNGNLALGIGVGVAIGAIIALAPPVISIPRDQYIVDYGRASDDELYEALTAPPVERLDRSYSLEEIRYNAPLRERMRRIDVNTVTFDFGSWDVAPGQYDSLARIASVINRALDRNANEVFLIEGHSDAVGSEEDNLTLSDRRAQSVAEILTSQFNVPPENLVTQGYGEEQLKIQTQEPERGNRRIAFRRVTPLLSEQTQTQ